MTGNTVRLNAIEAVRSADRPAPIYSQEMSVVDTFGSNVFSRAVMGQRLPKTVFASLMATLDDGAPLDPAIADIVAVVMKDWAMEQGASHYAHVFFPLTHLTAEKHDSFFEPSGDGGTIAEFSGKALIQGEPDASSFPNGGLRATFEARGYTGWDATSPAYILENPNGKTLCIPTVFVSMTGDALDSKTPLLRSQQAMAQQADRVLRLFGHEDPAVVVSYAGAEQEYFLVDRAFFLARPDLISAGRTLFGAKPPKGQEFDDHYFGAIPERVLACMMECEHELFKLGIPAKTRHNEVAPGQFEIAPVFERSNVAADHQQLLMTIFKQVARKHGMECLFHEKPFAGINGSGKHVNFSIGNATQGNLLSPGDTPHDNAQFLVFCAAVIRAVHRYGGLLRVSVASATNDHRLGANEAPPAIISIFLGDQLADVFEQIAAGGATSSKERGTLQVGVDTLPVLPTDPGDRNRTSPFAFTGNRFEFRAPGSLQSIAGPMTMINAILADSLDAIASRLEALLVEGSAFNGAVQTVLAEIIRDHGAVVFNGDGYADAWQDEAAARGLLNLKTTPDALGQLISPEAIDLFGRFGILSEREAHSRYEIGLEQYLLTVNVEAAAVLKMASTAVLPAAVRFQTELAANAAALRSVGLEADLGDLEQVSGVLASLRDGITALETASAADPGGSELDAAVHAKDVLLPAMAEIRSAADRLEVLVADDLWPLPTYQEMLFIR